MTVVIGRRSPIFRIRKRTTGAMNTFLSSFRPEWMDDPHVKCKGVMGFMYPNQPSSQVMQAKEVCNGRDGKTYPCAFRETCLRHAIDNHEAYGVWGGTSERDRRKIQRARNKYHNTGIYDLEDVRFPDVVQIRLQRTIPVRRRSVAA